MKIEKIDTNKIKVTFTSEDLTEHNLTPDSVRNNSPRVQKIIMNVVRQAEEEIGFCAENARLMVEAMPAEDDSMVMYITRLESENDFSDALNLVKRRIRLKTRPAEPKSTYTLVEFESFEDAVSLSRFASHISEGELYFYRDAYCLIMPSALAVRFSEFGKVKDSEKACDMVREHGKKICDNALETLRNYF